MEDEIRSEAPAKGHAVAENNEESAAPSFQKPAFKKPAFKKRVPASKGGDLEALPTAVWRERESRSASNRS